MSRRFTPRTAKTAQDPKSETPHPVTLHTHNKNINYGPVGLSLMVALMGSAANAQEPPIDHVPELPSVTVTATMSEQDARTAPASTTIVNRQEIQTRNIGDLRDILADESGVSFTQAGGVGRKAISLRGMAGHHVLSLVDGRRIPASDDVFGHADYQYGWLPMVAIDRIEVIRGPMSTLYGSEALGGVINVLTRKPGHEWQGSISVKGASSATEGAETTAGSASFFVAGPVNERLGIRAFGETAEQNPTPNPDQPQYSELEGRRLNMGGVAAYLAITPEQTLELSHEQGTEVRFYDAQGRGTATDPLLFRNRYEIDRTATAIGWHGDFATWKGELSAYRSAIDVSNRRSNNARATMPQTLTDQVLAGHASRVIGPHLVTVGGELGSETLDNVDLKQGRKSTRHQALFVQNELAISDPLTLTAGLRYDRHQAFGTELSPRLYLVWQASPDLVIKGGYGHAFRAPTLKQSSEEYTGVQGIYTFLGNSAIKPERLDSYELSMDWQIDALDIQLVAFHSQARDLIVNSLVRTIGFRQIYQATNVQHARLSGLEAGLTWRINDSVSWVNNLGLLRTKDLDMGTELEYRPRSTLNSRLDFNGPGGWSARVGLNYTGSQYRNDTDRLPAYSMWNASVANQLTKNYSVRIGVDNLGDVRLADKSPNFRHVERGRMVYINLLADF